MKQILTSSRQKYFLDIAQSISQHDVQFIVLTHVLPDRPELLLAIEKISPISLLIAIPYSTDVSTYNQLKNQYPIARPALEQLYDKTYLLSTLQHYIQPDKPVVILEVGGYFSPLIKELKALLKRQFIGVIEDTESGHRRYELYQENLPCPVVSVARSTLKDSEDFLVGSSCSFSLESLLRRYGFPLRGRQCLTIGFGKVGRGVAYAISHQQCGVSIYDADPICRVKAMSEGFRVPAKEVAFKQADIILGSTGNYAIKGTDFYRLKNGVVLVSCSSKDIEFDLSFLSQHYQAHPVAEDLTCYERHGQHIYLVNHGQPINFHDGAVIGPVLALVQAEILVAIQQLIILRDQCGIFEVDPARREWLATLWLKYFCDEETGDYRVGDDFSLANFSKEHDNIVAFGG